MGQPKALLRWAGRPAALAIAEVLSCCPLRVLVVRPGADWATAELLAAYTQVENPQPERGMLSSLQCGLAEVRARGAHPVLVMPVDCLGVHQQTARLLLEVHARQGRTLVPTWQGRDGHPVLLARDALELVLAADPARTTLRRLLALLDPPPLRLEVDDRGILSNVNTPDELAALLPDTPPRGAWGEAGEASPPEEVDHAHNAP